MPLPNLIPTFSFSHRPFSPPSPFPVTNGWFLYSSLRPTPAPLSSFPTLSLSWSHFLDPVLSSARLVLRPIYDSQLFQIFLQC